MVNEAEGTKDAGTDKEAVDKVVIEGTKDANADKEVSNTAATEAPNNKEAVNAAVIEEDFKDVKTGKKSLISADLKNTLIMVVIALISVVCSFAFVSKMSISSKEVDFEAQDVNSVSTVETAGDVLQGDTGVRPENKKVKTGKVKTDKGKTGKVNKAIAEKGNTGDINDDEEAGGIENKIVVPLDSIVVNLGGIDSNRYLRIQISVEVDSEDAQKLITEKKIILRDKMISFFSTKTLKDVESEGGLFKLRLEIKDSLNKLLGSRDMVKQIYFSDFIVQ
ncbi:MAG: flagellar basal body-associated FliL family protein [Planctomycetota bacterium]|jgi:flagellar FliL protein